MPTPLRVLIAEDRPTDAELMVYELSRSGFELKWKRVETEAEYLTELATVPDVILADHTLPQFNAPRALDLLKETGLDIPLIVVTGSISEEVAVERIKQGAADYILKDRMTRLGAAVKRALEEKKLRDERRKAEELIHRNLERIRALHEIDKAITSTLELRMVLEFLLERIGLFLPQASATTIRLLNKESGLLEPVTCRNLNEVVWKAEEGKAGRGLANVVFETKVPLMVRNVQADPRTRNREFFMRYGLISYLGVPLMAKREVLGVLGFYTKEEHEFTDEEIEFLATLAGQAAIAIHNSQLYEEARTREARLQETNRMLSALHAVAAATSQSLDLDRVFQAAIERITEIFRLDATQIHIYNERTDELLLGAYFARDPNRFALVKSFRRGQGIVGRVAESGKPLIFEDVQTDPLYQQFSRTKVSGQFDYHFFAVFPIRGKLKSLGTLACTGIAPRKLNSGEIQLLETIADEIAGSIENSQLYEKVRQKVEELQQKTAELERSNKVKDEFLSVMSHELRTPLNVVVGYAGMMQEGMLGEINPKQAEACTKIIRRTNDLLWMVNSILYTTSLEANEVKVETHEVNLGDFLNELKSSLSTPPDKDLSLRWDYPSDLPTITTDAAKLKHVLLNLVNNAIKFTEKGSVTISAKISQKAAANGQRSSVEFQVADTGIGIAKENLPIIFDKFKQIDSSETRLFGGVGLGLYIAKEFTALIGGKIEVESEPGKGSTFTVTIPYEN
jgi:signal transduction histidine kinase/FixJ family two-component response regulator/putative methionine-R-sulfoxide reductase with GAF domain